MTNVNYKLYCKCGKDKPVFANGNLRNNCYQCMPKPEKTPRKKYEFKAKKEATCIRCSASFIQLTYHNKYCSRTCGIAYINTKKQINAVDRSSRACRCCGVYFMPEYGNKNKLQCSDLCLKKANSDRANKYDIVKSKNDFIYKLRRSIRSFIWKAIDRRGFSKNEKAEKILGCNVQEFKKHIERQFLIGMNWDNRSKWHIDHIIPMSAAKNEKEVIMANHFTNLRPMWAKDNLLKGAKVTHLL